MQLHYTTPIDSIRKLLRAFGGWHTDADDAFAGENKKHDDVDDFTLTDDVYTELEEN